MPTFNQLVRKGRQTSAKKIYSSGSTERLQLFKKKATDASSPQKRGVCTAVKTATLKSLTQLLEKSPEFVFPTESK